MSMPATLRICDRNNSSYLSDADMIEKKTKIDRNAATEYHRIVQFKSELGKQSQKNEYQLPRTTYSTPRKDQLQRNLNNKLPIK